MGLETIRQSGRDALDIWGRARSPREAVKALLPPAWLRREVLNDGAGPHDLGALGEAAVAMRRLVNQLKAEAYDLGAGRVRYADLRGSPTYAALEDVSRALAALTPADLRGDDEILAFWINLYNALVVHGVVRPGGDEHLTEPGMVRDEPPLLQQIGADAATRRAEVLRDVEHAERGVRAKPLRRTRQARSRTTAA